MIGFDSLGSDATSSSMMISHTTVALEGGFEVLQRTLAQLAGGLQVRTRVRQSIAGSFTVQRLGRVLRTFSGGFMTLQQVQRTLTGSFTVQSLSGPHLPASRTLRWPVGSNQPTALGNFTLANGRPTIGKDPDSVLIYAVDLVDWMEDAGTSLQVVTASVVRGVEIVGEAFVQGSCVAAMFRGLSLLDGAPNCCTFHFVCADGQESDATIFFEKEET